MGKHRADTEPVTRGWGRGATLGVAAAALLAGGASSALAGEAPSGGHEDASASYDGADHDRHHGDGDEGETGAGHHRDGHRPSTPMAPPMPPPECVVLGPIEGLLGGSTCTAPEDADGEGEAGDMAGDMAGGMAPVTPPGTVEPGTVEPGMSEEDEGEAEDEDESGPPPSEMTDVEGVEDVEDTDDAADELPEEDAGDAAATEPVLADVM